MTPHPDLASCPSVLVVEGYSDLLFAAEVLEDLGISDRVFIQDMRGKANLAKLETLLNPALLASKETIGVMVDANGSPSDTALSVRAALQKATGTETHHGTWSSGRPRVGFFVVPSDGVPGELETLVWQAWSAQDANADAKACVEAYVDCMARGGMVPKSRDKGLVGALFSVIADEDPRLGSAARSGVVDLAMPGLAGLRDWFAGL